MDSSNQRLVRLRISMVTTRQSQTMILTAPLIRSGRFREQIRLSYLAQQFKLPAIHVER